MSMMRMIRANYVLLDNIMPIWHTWKANFGNG